MTTQDSNMATGLMNLNTAMPAELATLEGIAEKRAEAIVGWREANGPITKENCKLITEVPARMWDQLIADETVLFAEAQKTPPPASQPPMLQPQRQLTPNSALREMIKMMELQKAQWEEINRSQLEESKRRQQQWEEERRQHLEDQQRQQEQWLQQQEKARVRQREEFEREQERRHHEMQRRHEQQMKQLMDSLYSKPELGSRGRHSTGIQDNAQGIADMPPHKGGAEEVGGVTPIQR